jgi:hypothetical protein
MLLNLFLAILLKAITTQGDKEEEEGGDPGQKVEDVA